jgi:hypothetical protein
VAVSVNLFEVGLMRMRMRVLSAVLMGVGVFVLDVAVLMGGVGVGHLAMGVVMGVGIVVGVLGHDGSFR